MQKTVPVLDFKGKIDSTKLAMYHLQIARERNELFVKAHHPHNRISSVRYSDKIKLDYHTLAKNCIFTGTGLNRLSSDNIRPSFLAEALCRQIISQVHNSPEHICCTGCRPSSNTASLNHIFCLDLYKSAIATHQNMKSASISNQEHRIIQRRHIGVHRGVHLCINVIHPACRLSSDIGHMQTHSLIRGANGLKEGK